MERVREVCLRGLLKRVWIVAAERKTRMPVAMIVLALRLNGASVGGVGGDDDPEDDGTEMIGDEEAKDDKEKENDALDEAECIAAGMIYRGFVRGYISHEKRMVVLAAKDPFPRLVGVAIKK